MAFMLCMDESREYDPVKAAAKIVEMNEEQRKRLERALELYGLEQEGRLVVLPCKVGDVLYRTNNQKYEVYEIEVSREFISEGKITIFAHPFISETKKATCYEVFEVSAIGKTVFLTREEAEAAVQREDRAVPGELRCEDGCRRR